MTDTTGRTVSYPENVFKGRLPDHLERELSIELYALQCEILEAVTRGLDIDYIADLLCRRVESLAPAVVCSVLLIVDGCLQPLAAPSLPQNFILALYGLPIGPEIGSCGSSAFFGTEVDIPDILVDKRWRPYSEIPLSAGLKACWSSPISSRDGKVIGTFALYFRTCRSPEPVERQIVNACLHLCTLIIERQTVLSALTRTNQFLDATLDTMSQGLCLFNDQEVLMVVNRRFTTIYDLPPDGLRPGMSLSNVAASISPACRDEVTPEKLSAIWRAIFVDGRPKQIIDRLRNNRVVCISGLPVGDGSWLATVEDVTERHQAETRISHMALHDTLTGLPNRAFFHETLAATLGKAPCALLTLDLDRFKAINDGYGHPVGDALLTMIAERLRSCTSSQGFVTRLGGDEFAVLLTEPGDRQAAGELADRMMTSIAQPFLIENRLIEIAASIGIALAPSDAATAEQLLRCSDIALYRTKHDQPGCYRFYHPEMNRRLEERRTLEADLRHALRHGDFQLFYQPVLSLHTNTVSGFEALLRWHHPERGMVSPAIFIPVAEEAGLIVELGAWVLRTACKAAAAWPNGIKVAVNLSAAQFNDKLIGLVSSALEQSGLAADRLDLELTESVLLNNSAEILFVLQRLRNMGVQISMDDFGTGYSSLSYLNRFPFTRIKVDRSFISNLPEGREALAIVRAVVGLGNTLEMVITAEGVETRSQLDILRAEGCDEVQGYLFSHPLPADRLLDMLTNAARSLAD